MYTLEKSAGCRMKSDRDGRLLVLVCAWDSDVCYRMLKCHVVSLTVCTRSTDRNRTSFTSEYNTLQVRARNLLRARSGSPSRTSEIRTKGRIRLIQYGKRDWAAEGWPQEPQVESYVIPNLLHVRSPRGPSSMLWGG